MVSLSDCALVVHDSYAQDFDTPDDVLRPDPESAPVGEDIIGRNSSNSNSMLADTAAAVRAAANAQELFGYESLDEDEDDGGGNNGEDEVWD